LTTPIGPPRRPRRAARPHERRAAGGHPGGQRLPTRFPGSSLRNDGDP